MADTPSLSNTAAGEPPPGFAKALAAWGAGLADQAAALHSYMTEAGDSGLRLLATGWSAAAASVIEAEGRLGVEGKAGALAPGLGEPRAVLDAADAVEGLARTLSAAAATILDPSVRASAGAGLSRTFSEGLRGLGRRARAAERAAEVQRRAASVAAASMGAWMAARHSLTALRSAYATGRGGISAELYNSALYCLSGGGERAAALAALEDARDEALGLVADTAAAAGADTAALSEYHPLQAMTYALGPSLPAAGPSPPAAALDLILPSARESVHYELAALIDADRARTGGRVASKCTGLNFPLVERLRTIRVAPRPAPVSHGADAKDAKSVPGPTPAGHWLLPAGTPLWVTTDGGGSTRALAPGVEGGAWAPLAGSRPRVERLATASAEVILAEVRRGRARGWGLALSEEFREAARAAGEGGAGGAAGLSAEELVAGLAAAFERQFDAAPPSTAAELRELAAPAVFEPGCYVCGAVALLADAHLDRSLQGLHARPGALRTPFVVAEREMRVTQAVQAFEAAQELWRRLRGVAWGLPPEAYARPGPRLRAEALRAYRRGAAAAVAAAPLDCAPPSLKRHAALALPAER
jgi:hypothetical protein